MDGIGLGDVKLMSAGAAWLGLVPSLSVLFIACCGGILAIGVAIWRSGDQSRRGIAFGPFIALAIWVVWLYGPVL